MSFIRLIAIAVCLFMCSFASANEADLGAVKKRFDEYVALSEKFDATVADIYSDEAVIKTDRHYPDGSVKKRQIAGAACKKLVRATMPIAKVRGDVSTYADVKVEPAEGGNVRVSAQRTSKLKNYTSPVSWIYAKSADGKWLIIEEQSVTKP